MKTRLTALLHRALGRRPADRTVLFADCNFPRPQHDAGSVGTMSLLDGLQGLGFRVAFIALGEFFLPPEKRDGAARQMLEARGIRCVTPGEMAAPSGHAGITEALRVLPAFSACVLARHSCGGAFLDLFRGLWPDARYIFLPVDLHFIREEREAAVSGDEALLNGVQETRAKEEALIRACDATLLFSEYETEVARKLVPGARVLTVPLAHAGAQQATLTGRADIAFIGNFGHRPNGDAVRYFLDEIWPDLRRENQGIRFHVIGDNPPDWLQTNEAAGVIVHGHVPALEEMLRHIRLTVAPLRFGAGVKGKVITSFAQGIPCVMTEVAAEGLSFPPEILRCCLATEGRSFAVLADALMQDDLLWERVSREGQAAADARHGPAAVGKCLKNLMEMTGL